jgi:hypothetical protein
VAQNFLPFEDFFYDPDGGSSSSCCTPGVLGVAARPARRRVAEGQCRFPGRAVVSLAEVRAIGSGDATWDELETVPEEFTDAGGPGPRHCLLPGARTGQRNRVRGASFDVYTFSDGKCVRKREFRERSEAVEAAGLD